MVGFDDFLGLGLSPRTAYMYARMVDRVGPLLEERGTDLAGCRALDLAAVAEMFSRSYSQREILRAAMTAAWQVIGREDPPVRALRVPPRPRGRCRALSTEGARQLESKAWELQDEPCGLAVLLGLYSGMRRAEIAGLRWEDVLLEEHGTPEWFRVHGKGGLVADIPVHPVLAAVLARQYRSGGYVFKGRQPGRPVSPATVWHWVRYVSKEAGLPPVKTHVLRHTALAEANDRTGDLRAVQSIARHSKIETTLIYTRTTAQRMHEVMASISYGRLPA